MESVDTGTLVLPRKVTEHNNYLREGNRIPVRLSSVPSPAIAGRPANRTAPTESGQPLPCSITDEQATPPVTLHALRLGDGQQRVRHESVIAEHRVVEAPHPDSVEPRTKTVADVLRHAALLIEERGWCQNDWFTESGRQCVYGAVAAVQGLSSTAGAGSPAAQAVYRYTVDRFGQSPIPWNDAPGRTAAEVIAALRAAADEAER